MQLKFLAESKDILAWQAQARNDGLTLTNLFPDPRKMGDWMRRKVAFAVVGIADCRPLVIHEDGFDRLFFCATSIEAAAKACGAYQMACGNVCVLDHVGMAQTQQAAASAFAENGFEIMKTLTRLSRRQNVFVEKTDDLDCRFAEECDAKPIYGLLQSYFNPFAEQLPTEEMVADLCVSGLSFVVCKDGIIQAFLLGEGQGKKSVVRYWFSLPDNRNAGCGGQVMRRYFARCAELGVVAQELWVIDTNDNAIKRYDHYGFRPGMLKDYVFIKGKGSEA